MENFCYEIQSFIAGRLSVKASVRSGVSNAMLAGIVFDSHLVSVLTTGGEAAAEVVLVVGAGAGVEVATSLHSNPCVADISVAVSFFKTKPIYLPSVMTVLNSPRRPFKLISATNSRVPSFFVTETLTDTSPLIDICS